MSLTAVVQAQPDEREDFIRKTLLWFREKRKSDWPRGNGHLGLSKTELEAPFNRYFRVTAPALDDVINAMLDKGTLVAVFRKYETRGEGYYRKSVLDEVKFFRRLPPEDELEHRKLRFYLPEMVGRDIKSKYKTNTEIDEMIRDILHPAPASVKATS